MDKNNFIMSFTIDNTFDSDQFLKLRLRVCHDGESPNRTYFTRETMAEANKSLEYIPLLAHVYTDENGKPVIGAHDMHIEEDKLNEGESRVIYDETPIGVVPSLADNNCTIEEYEGLNYTFVDCYLWRDYANYAEQLVEGAENTKLSMEIDMPDDALSYDAANERYNISAYRYRGITLLNESLGTGMKHALATTTNFSTNEDIKSKMIVLMEELKKCLYEYDQQNSDEKGGNVNMENEEIIETTIDETVDETIEEQTVVEEEVFEEEIVTEEATEIEEFSENEKEPLVCTFRISHDDTRYALQNLLNSLCEEGQFLYIESVYDGYFYYADYFTGDAFKQGYKIRKDVVSLSGDPERVYREFVTQAEKDELENMRKNYSALESEYNELKKFKDEYDANQLHSQREEILVADEYSVLAENAEFKALISDMDKYSVDELKVQADLIFAAHVKTLGEFSVKQKDEKKPKTLQFSVKTTETKKKKAYGDLFSDKK